MPKMSLDFSQMRASGDDGGKQHEWSGGAKERLVFAEGLKARTAKVDLRAAAYLQCKLATATLKLSLKNGRREICLNCSTRFWHRS
jgi:hypothetical protein